MTPGGVPPPDGPPQQPPQVWQPPPPGWGGQPGWGGPAWGPPPGTVPPLVPWVPGPQVPYSRLARTPSYAWWKPLVELLLAVGLWFVGLLLVMGIAAGLTVALGGELDAQSGFPEDPTLASLVGLGTIVVVLPAVVLAARVVRGRWGTLSSVRLRLRRRELLISTALAVPLIALLFVVAGLAESALAGADAAGEPEEFAFVGWRSFLPLAAVLLVLVPLQAAAEEYLFRGTLVQVLGAWVRTPWPGIALAAVLFALAHGLGSVAGFLSLLVFSVLLSVVVQRTGGLEAAIAWHAVNNVAGFLLLAASGGLDPDVETAASATWAFAVADAVVLAVYCALVVRLSRRAAERPDQAPARTMSGL